mgnify:CR=1 FL=1
MEAKAQGPLTTVSTTQGEAWRDCSKWVEPRSAMADRRHGQIAGRGMLPLMM